MSQGIPNPYAAPKHAVPPIKQKSNEAPLASLGDRLIGAILDGLIMAVPVIVLAVGLGFALVLTGIDPDSIAGDLIFSVLGSLLGIGIFMAINGYLLATYGQTVGKMIVKTQIVADDGSQIPFAAMIGKRYLPIWLLSMLPFVGGVIGLVNVLLIFRANRKCLHDEICGSKVVSLR